MSTVTPCKFCGCSETNLIDGFYYCTECGTQDTNVRETIIETVIFADGEVAKTGRKSLKIIPQAEVQMPDDWYKWHTLNYLLRGLADELIEAGAKPSFKTKLLWIWTRYMDKYQNKADFGLTTTEEAQNDENDEDLAENDKFSDDDDDDDPTKQIWFTKKIDIKRVSMPLIISMIYVALNLDKSHIQLGHLLRLMKQEKISVLGWLKLVPKELRPKKLKNTLFFNYKCFIFTYPTIIRMSVIVFRDLDLGNPIVPDLRVILDDYIQELCLPNDIKPLVISLIHARSFDYLDINVQYKDISKMPSYELYVMAHILMALKICFGLDSEYEFVISDIVEKLNKQENYPKSYINRNCESERLFNFRDWCSYIRFRKAMLSAHTFHLGAPSVMDVNDYVAMEHLAEKPDYKCTLNEEITADILKKIPNSDLDVIPRSEFATTITPYTAYTKVILDHVQDPEVKALLSEDFTKYSLKYITEDMFLIDPDSWNPENVLKGVDKSKKIVTNQKFVIADDVIKPQASFRKYVYVKDCDNHNWMVTQRPKLEHVVKDESDGKENDDLNALKVINQILDESIECNKDSKEESKIVLDATYFEMDSKDDSKLSVDSNMNETKVDEEVSKEIKQLQILEENEDANIFDDDFVDLETKKEEIEPPERNEEEINFDNIDVTNLRYDNDEYIENANDANSDVSSEDSLRMNPDSLNREEAIKELVIHACQKYKISVPGVYLTRKRRSVALRAGPRPRVHHGLGEVKQKIQGFMAEYRTLMENDLFHQMASKVQMAIVEFNRTKDEDVIDEGPTSEVGESAEDPNQTIDNVADDKLDNTAAETINNDTMKDDEYKLFGDSSDGETHADELLPKKNPDYDEKTHDITQLYIKPDKNIEFPLMELNPKLHKIIDKKIKDEMENPKSFDVPAKEEIDSEDELPLNVLMEQRNLRKRMREQEKLASSLKPLIKNTRMCSCQYWTKQFISYGTDEAKQPFTIQMDKFPTSFAFVLQVCADVAGYEVYSVYRALMDIESFLTHSNAVFGNGIKRPAPEFNKSLSNTAKKKRPA